MTAQNYGAYLHRRIAELEQAKESLFDRLLAAKNEEDSSFNRFKQEERQRLTLELQVRELRDAIAFQQAENRRLQNLMSEHVTLLDELDKVRCELKLERRKNRRLEKQLNRRTGKEGYFGLATPSALRINKPGATADNREKKGGAKVGHTGHGRKDFSITEADEVIVLDREPPPCDCGCHRGWMAGEIREHCVIERIPARTEKRFYLKTEFACIGCGQRTTMPTPNVIPNGRYGNSIVAHLLAEHYLHGLTAGNVSRRENIHEGSFFQMAARCAAMLKPTFEQLLVKLRSCEIVHADETSWRNDGCKAFGWIFANSELTVLLFRDTRSGKVARGVFGDDPLEVNVISDRYKGYDKLKVNRQYCYTHLLRDLKNLEKDFPDELEIAAFAVEIKPLLKSAIAMYKSPLPLPEYRRTADAIKDKIMDACNREANHPGIQHFQNIFRKHPERCFQWVKSPNIPAENNFAERGLRPSVIARKISFGSQSDLGMQTREILMTFLYTARTRGLDPAATLEQALNLLCRNQTADILPLLGFVTASRND